jgi:hypothetical protein
MCRRVQPNLLKTRAPHILKMTTMVEFHPMMTKVENQGIILLPADFEDELVVADSKSTKNHSDFIPPLKL